MSDEPEILLEKLRVALSLVETLTKENDAYKENFEQLKNAHDRLQEQYDSLGRECELTSKDKASIETQTAEQLAYFKAQLDNKSREVDSLKGRIPLAKEMELAHLKAVHQMQEDNERRWKQMVTETEKFRSLYYNLRRNYEVAMTDIERERAQMTGKLKELEEDYQVEMNALEEKMMELRQRLEAAGDTKHIRELQRVNTEVQLKIQALLSEVEELRAEKEKLVVDIEQQSRLHQRKLVDEVAHAKTLQAEKDALKSKVTSLEAENIRLLRLQESVTEENGALTKEKDRAQNRLEEAIHRHKVEISDIQHNSLKQKNEYENSIVEMKQKIHELESNLKSATETIQTLRDRLCCGEKDLLERLRVAREEEWSKRAQIEADKNHLEAQLADMTRRAADTEAQAASLQKDLQQEISTLKQTLLSLKSQNDALTNQSMAHATAVEDLQSNVQLLKSALSEAEARGSGLSKDVETRMVELENARESMAKTQSVIDALNMQLAQTKEQMEKEREAYYHNTERYRTNWAKEKTSLTQALSTVTRDKETLEDKAHQLEELLEKAQSLFKSKLQTVRTKVKTYKDEIQMLRKNLESETARADAISREIHQRQSAFLGLLKTEGMLESVA